MTLFGNMHPQIKLAPYFSLTYGTIFKTLPSICVSSTTHPISSSFRSIAVTNKLRDEAPIRRSANYPPPNWELDYVQSLKNEYSDERYINRSNELKEQVKMMLDEEVERLNLLELIDDLQRLGVSYQFQDKIQSFLSGIYSENCINSSTNEKDLNATALGFRLLRQHGFDISQEVFNCFMDERGDFKPNLGKDTKGMLHLYEASYLLKESENTLELARKFSAKHLKKNLDDNEIDQELAELVQHALELPLHWRVLRLEARWFIDIYEKRPDFNPTLLEFAKLDFNIVQESHRNDLKYVSSWWRRTCLAKKLTFARDRLVENFFWNVGVMFDPQHGYGRRMSTKVNALITTIDDIYDVYGTLEELELFTAAVERWDVEVMDQLPDYMRICYFALHNCINEMAYDVMKEQDISIIPYLRKAWVDLCKSYLQEAKWYHGGYIPTLHEYLDNALISTSVPLNLVHACFLVSNPIEKEALECLDKYHNIIRFSAMILRLADDLGASSDELKRGDVAKSVQCYMNESGASEEDAREYIRFLIDETWKQMNKERVADSLFPKTFMEMAMNICRMAQCVYQHGDGIIGRSNVQTKDRIRALLFQPIGLP